MEVLKKKPAMSTFMTRIPTGLAEMITSLQKRAKIHGRYLDVGGVTTTALYRYVKQVSDELAGLDTKAGIGDLSPILDPTEETK